MNKHVKGQKKSLWPTYEFRVSKNLLTCLYYKINIAGKKLSSNDLISYTEMPLGFQTRVGKQ